MKCNQIIRREKHCQILSEIVASDEYMIVGIDVAKEKHHAFMGTATGKSLLRKLIFENNNQGFKQLVQTVESIRTIHGLPKVVYGFEPTGDYHKPLARYLADSGADVVQVDNQAVKHNRQTLDGRWDKNDTKDAANVTDLISRRRCVFYDTPPDAICEIRSLLSLRRRLKKDQHRLKIRIRNHLLAQYFPELDQFYGACETETMAIIRWCLDPKEITAMSFERFFQIATHKRKGLPQKLRLQRIYQAASCSVGLEVGAAAKYEGQLLVEMLETIGKQRKETEVLIEENCQALPAYRYLVTIPGFGPYVTAVTIAAIVDPFRFDGRKQLLKFAGLDLCATRSGKTSIKAVPKISKKGNAELRYALYQAAKVASGRVDCFRDYFANTVSGRQKEPGITTKMRVKLAAKMLVIAWTLMKKQQCFDPGHLIIG